MIELLRYARLKPLGLASAKDEGGLVVVSFKRFSVENGQEIEPEQSILNYDELRKRLAEVRTETQALEELLKLESHG